MQSATPESHPKRPPVPLEVWPRAYCGCRVSSVAVTFPGPFSWLAGMLIFMHLSSGAYEGKYSSELWGVWSRFRLPVPLHFTERMGGLYLPPSIYWKGTYSIKASNERTSAAINMNLKAILNSKYLWNHDWEPTVAFRECISTSVLKSRGSCVSIYFGFGIESELYLRSRNFGVYTSKVTGYSWGVKTVSAA